MTVTVTDRARLLDCIADANWQAKREQSIVMVPTHEPSHWDEAHEYLNLLLDDLRKAGA